MKRKMLSMFIAGAISVSAISAVAADELAQEETIVSTDISAEENISDNNIEAIINTSFDNDINTEENHISADTELITEETNSETDEAVYDDEENIMQINETIFTEINGTEYFPVREVFEDMGFNIEWQNDTKTVIVEKLPLYITFTIGTDGYTIAKTAPIRLGAAPVIIDGKSYAPVSLFTDLLEMNL